MILTSLIFLCLGVIQIPVSYTHLDVYKRQAYNAGIGHVLDAIALAEKYGKNKYVWDNSCLLYTSRCV